MNQLDRALIELAEVFERLAVQYAVMGGLAVRVYGIPRPTQDIDLTVAIDRARLPDFFAAAQRIGYTIAEPYLTGWVDQVAGMPLVKLRRYVGQNGLDVDVFLAESKYQQQVLSRRRNEPIADRAVWLVSPEDLVLLKVLAGRPRDIADIGDILFTQGQLDEPYMRHWAAELGVLERLENVLAEPPL